MIYQYARLLSIICLNRFFFFALLTGLTAQSSLAQITRFVSPTGTNNDPSVAITWATSTTDLQGAINASTYGDQIWVAAGTYKPGGNTNADRNTSFSMKTDVAIYGGFVGNETTRTSRPMINPVAGQPSSSSLSGEIGESGSTTDNSYHVISNSNLTTTAVLDGFVITGGAAGSSGGGAMYNSRSSPTLQNCLFYANVASGGYYSYGGAMYNLSSSPQLTNCLFQNNQASEGRAENYGGAMCNESNSRPQLTDCSFQNNLASGGNHSYGGAIFNDYSSPQLTRCSFQNNRASGGTTSNNYGGGIYNTNSSPQLTDCSFKNNLVSGVVSSNGGAMYNGGSSSPQLTNCSFQNNQASGGYGSNVGGVMVNTPYSNPKITNCSFQNNQALGIPGSRNYGGVMYNSNISPQIINCSFQNNLVSGGSHTCGGAIYNMYSNPQLTNCSFQNNQVLEGYFVNHGGAICNVSSSPQLVNCVLFGNGAGNTFFDEYNSSVTATYSLFDDSVTGYISDPTNLTTVISPFVNVLTIELAPTSAAINAGNNAAYTATNGPATDIVGNTRIVGPAIDMGAYEFINNPLPVTLRYVNGRMTDAGRCWAGPPPARSTTPASRSSAAGMRSRSSPSVPCRAWPRTAIRLQN
jgi:hypothetical protein